MDTNGPDLTMQEGWSNFGESLAISADGKTLAVGGPAADYFSNEDNVGEVRVFQYSETTKLWTQKGRSLQGQGNVHEDFGDRIDLSQDGNILAVGIPGHYSFKTVGFVRVYEYSRGDWVQVGQTLQGIEVGALFGRDVSLSSDGRTLAVGVAQFGGRFEDGGYVQVFRLGTNSEWNQLGSLVHGEAEEDYFGRTLALSGDASLLAVRGTRFIRLFAFVDDNWVRLGEQDSGTSYYNSADISQDGTAVITGGRVFDIPSLNACLQDVGIMQSPTLSPTVGPSSNDQDGSQDVRTT